MSKLEVDAIEPQSGTTLTLGASGDAVNIASGASITDFKSTGIDDNATSTAITIDSSEIVRIGNTSSTNSLIPNNHQLVIGNESSGASGIALIAPNNENSYVSFFDPDDSGTFRGSINYNHASDFLRTYVNGSERMRIDSSGNVFIAKTASSNSTAGVELQSNGIITAVRDADTPLLINRLTNDGILAYLQQNTVAEGTISVLGATVSYNGFTGTHWSRFQNNSTPAILRGTVLESLDEMCDWYNLHFETTTTTQDENGNDVTKTENHVVPYVLQDGQSDGDVITYDWNTEKKDEDDNDIIEQVQATIVKEADIKHVKSKVSDTVDAKNVYGVFVAYDLDGEGYNDFYVASVGSFVVRIKQGETVAKGDLLQSNGDGTAKVQTDDAVRSSSFAKVLSTTVIETYDDGSFIVPCSLMC